MEELREEIDGHYADLREAKARIGYLEARLSAAGHAVASDEEDEEDPHDADSYVVLDHYEVRGLSGDAFLGEGPHSTVWMATDIRTERPVALKTFKQNEDGSSEEDDAAMLEKFCRHVRIFKKLTEPLVKEKCPPGTWHPSLEGIDLGSLFVRMVDHSKDSSGNAGLAADHNLYLILETCEYTLKEYLSKKNTDPEEVSKTMAVVSKTVTTIVA